MKIYPFALLTTVALAACTGDDSVHHLPDAPALGDAALADVAHDTAEDAAPDATSERSLAIAFGGNGSGRVTSSPVGLACATSCESSFAHGTRITLTAEPDASSLFAGWTGACSGALPVCELTIEAASTVTARFALKTYSVTVSRAGAGTGIVSGSGISCGTSCAMTVDHGTMISLAAMPTALSHFVGWGDACTGTGACSLAITGDTAISAVFALDELSLVVTRGGNGTGTITSTPAGIACGSDCTEVYAAAQMVALTASPAASSTFVGWGGACTGTGTCSVTMDTAKTVTGTFALQRHALTVQRIGTGTGVVTSMPAGIACGTDCTEDLDHGTEVTLTATASPTHTFTGWGGACSGTGSCVVTIDAAKTVTAAFAINTHDLTVATVGTGTVAAPQIACPGDCTGTYAHGTVVTLAATAGPGYSFAGWSGACSGTGACIVTMDAAKSVGAAFAIVTHDLTVTTVGTGSVTASQIDCPGDCLGTFPHGTAVTLAQTAGTGYTFTGWSGACSGMGACVVTLDAAKSVTATFTLDVHDLTVGVIGSGTITAPQIACPGDCTGTFDHGTQVTLVQTPGTGYSFTGWSGACTGTGACVVTMDAIKSVIATFTINSYNLTVSTAGTGTVTAPQIACPGDCTGTFTHGTMVTLAPTAGTGYSFTGWSGACTGTGACVVTMDAAKSVTATFTIKSYDLTVATAGTGTVTAPQIACPGDCTGTFTHGTMVTLAPTAGTGYAFSGWSGACTGIGACVVTMDAAKSVTATFTIKSYDLTVATVGTGTVTAPQIACPGDCTGTFTHGTMVTLAQTAATGYTFAGWNGACSGTGACVVTMTSANSVTATFTLNSYDLTVATVGSGTVTAPQINCPGDCTGTFSHGMVITLVQSAGTGYTFAGWGGACSGTGACVVPMTSANSVTATFTLNTYSLTVAVNGTGSVTAPQIACPGDCSGTFGHGTQVTLVQSAGAGYAFSGWSGACSGTGACVVTMDTAKSVTATFTINTYALSVAVTGGGSVASTPAGIAACTASTGTCNATFSSGTHVTLAQTTPTGYTFGGWSGGGCSGTGVCVVTMDAAKSVAATFTINSYALSVAVTGSGSVSSTPAGISACTASSGTCSAVFTHGTQVTLAQTTPTGYTFAGWSGGGCSGKGACVVTMTSANSVTATFTINTYALAVAVTGGGSVASTPAGIAACTASSGTCSAMFTHGTQVTLAQTTPPGYMFGGWSGGGCSGTGACVVTMTSANSVTATFTINTYALSVAVSGSGSVASTPAGISACTASSGSCSATFNHGTQVTLSASPGMGYTFSGWSGGGCSGTGTCVVPMTAANSVTATFTLASYTLSVSISGSGAVASNPIGIACSSGTCSATFTYGTMVTLGATPGGSGATASNFASWTGACAGSGPTCVLTITGPTSTQANFAIAPNILFTTSALYPESLGGYVGADNTCQAVARNANLIGTSRLQNTRFIAVLSTSQVSVASRLGGARGWIRRDGRPVFNSLSDLTVGAPPLPNNAAMDENGAPITSTFGVWTGSNPGGASGNVCTGYVTGGGLGEWVGDPNTADTGTSGNVSATSWNLIASDTTNCGARLRLLCLGIDRVSSVP